MSIPELNGPRALRRPRAAKSNEPLVIQRGHVALAKLSLHHFQCCGFRTTRGLADGAHVVDMEVHEFSKSLEARDPHFAWSLTAINLAFGLRGPAPCIMPAQEGLAHVASLVLDLDPPGPEGGFVKVANFGCAPCAHRRRNAAKNVASRRAFVCARYAPTI